MLVLKNAHVDTSALQAIARFLRQVVVGGGGGGWGWHLQSLLRLLGKLAAFYTNPPFHHSVLTDHRWFQPF